MEAELKNLVAEFKASQERGWEALYQAQGLRRFWVVPISRTASAVYVGDFVPRWA